MDKYSEIEAKFEADHLTPKDFLKTVADCYGRSVQSYKFVAGWDSYYRQGDSVIRHRCDGRRKTSVLTVKRRKSETSISDRHEIDLFLRENVHSKDVTHFLEMTGWSKLFTIEKESYIFFIEEADHVATLALYDVWTRSKGGLMEKPGRRFLEIEIEKDSDCSPAKARRLLATWTDRLRTQFALDAPMNQSLFEIFGPRAS